MLCTLQTSVPVAKSISLENWSLSMRRKRALSPPLSCYFPCPIFFFCWAFTRKASFWGGKFFDRRIRCIGRKCGSRCVVEQDIHVNFWVNFTWFSLCLLVCPLTETCSFWCGVKDLLTSSCTSYWQSCPWPLKLMTTHGIHRMWWFWAVQERMG